jgi:hypothetical protein
MEVIKDSADESTTSKTSDCISGEKGEQQDIITATNICIACKKSHRAVAFIPYVHYIACLSCCHGMKECPVYRSKIMACVRIYE